MVQAGVLVYRSARLVIVLEQKQWKKRVVIGQGNVHSIAEQQKIPESLLWTKLC